MSDTIYMHIYTGSIDTKENWLDCITEEELKLKGFDSEEALFDSYINQGLFVDIESETIN